MWWVPGMFSELVNAPRRLGRITSWIEPANTLSGWMYVRSLVDEDCDNELLARDEFVMPLYVPLTGIMTGTTETVLYRDVPYLRFKSNGIYQDPVDVHKA